MDHNIFISLSPSLREIVSHDSERVVLLEVHAMIAYMFYVCMHVCMSRYV